MISARMSSLFCTMILLVNCGRVHCQDNLGGVSDVQEMRSDLRNDTDYLDQIFQMFSKLIGKLDKVDQRLIQNEKRFNDTENQSKNLSGHVEKQLVELVRSQAESEVKLATLARSVHEIKWRTDVMQDSFPPESPFVLDATTLPGGRGTIVFYGNKMSSRKRRFWVLEKAETVKFTVVTNNLNSDSRLTISGFNIGSKTPADEVYINPSTATGREFTVSGVIILVTMSCIYSSGTSSFALSFFRSQNKTVFPSGRTLYPSSIETGEGQRVVSFPANNAVDYKNNANHFMLISRASEREFDLTRIFQDIESESDYYVPFEIRDDSERTRYVTYGEWSGRYGRVEYKLGRYSTLVLFFTSNPSLTGKGYELKIE